MGSTAAKPSETAVSVATGRVSVGRHAASAVLALGLVTGIAECVVRWTVATPAKYVEDPQLGLLPKPHSIRFQAEEGRAVSHYDALGLHNAKDLGPRLPGEMRILAIGDSLTEAVEVADDQNFAALLERQLRASLARPVTVINAGRMAYLAGEMLHAAQVLAPRVGAEAAIVTVRHGTFGVDHDSHVVLPGYWAGRYVLDSVGQVVFEPLHGPDLALKRFGWVRRLKESIALLDRGFGRLMQRLEKHATGPAPPLDLRLLHRRAEYFLAEQQRLFGGKLILVLVDRASLLTGSVDPSDLAIERMLARICAARGIHFWSTRTAGAELYAHTQRLPFGFPNSSSPGVGHLNIDGHQMVMNGVLPIAEKMLR